MGFIIPKLIDNNNMVLAGHGRMEAAQHLDMVTVPCIRLSRILEQQKRAYIVADNKLALNAGWDEDLLAEEFQILLETR